MRWLLKRWWFWAGPGFILVALAVGYIMIPIEQGPISQANCDRIQLGMTLGQVCEILPHWWTNERDEGPRQNTLIWVDEDRNKILVTIELANDYVTLNVTAKRFEPSELSFLERTKHRIERRIKALWP
jgi:hypothetical protein